MSLKFTHQWRHMSAAYVLCVYWDSLCYIGLVPTEHAHSAMSHFISRNARCQTTPWPVESHANHLCSSYKPFPRSLTLFFFFVVFTAAATSFTTAFLCEPPLVSPCSCSHSRESAGVAAEQKNTQSPTLEMCSYEACTRTNKDVAVILCYNFCKDSFYRVISKASQRTSAWSSGVLLHSWTVIRLYQFLVIFAQTAAPAA